MIIAITGATSELSVMIIKELNKRNYNDIIAVDILDTNEKSQRIASVDVLDFVHNDDFLSAVVNGDYDNGIDYIIHFGEYDKSDVTTMKHNFEYSYMLLQYAQKNEIPFIYLSNSQLSENNKDTSGTIYSYSKLLFDNNVKRYFSAGIKAPIVGFRFFENLSIFEQAQETVKVFNNHNNDSDEIIGIIDYK